MKKTIKSIIVDDMDHCLVCGRAYPEIHHCIFGTSNRKKSDQYGLIVPLCADHHRGDSGPHKNRSFDLYLKRAAQIAFELHYGNRDDFIKEFGKSYL